MSIRILDVGQCQVDGPRMTRMLESKVGVEVIESDSFEDAVARIGEGKFNLVMVNREFAFDGATGLDLIKQVKQSGNTTPIMLVSDRADAQAEAEAAGALRGFGKSKMEDPDTINLIKQAVGL